MWSAWWFGVVRCWEFPPTVCVSRVWWKTTPFLSLLLLSPSFVFSCLNLHFSLLFSFFTREPSQVMPHDYKRVLGEMAEAKANGIDWDEDEEGKSMVA